MNVPVESSVGAGIQAFQAQLLQLAVEGFNSVATVSQHHIHPSSDVGFHVFVANGDQPRPGLGENTEFVRALLEALSVYTPAPCQAKSQLIDGVKP